MSPVNPRCRLVSCLAAVLVAAARLAGDEAQITDNSPFLPPGGAAVVDATALDLRGIMSMPDGVVRYCIYDPVKKSSQWAGLNERGHGFVIKSADPNRGSVTLEADGRVLTLQLHQAKVTAMTNGPGQSPQVGNPGAPVVIDQAQRLQAIAAEVARRRALREQAALNPGAANGAGSPQQVRR